MAITFYDNSIDHENVFNKYINFCHKKIAFWWKIKISIQIILRFIKLEIINLRLLAIGLHLPDFVIQAGIREWGSPRNLSGRRRLAG